MDNKYKVRSTFVLLFFYATYLIIILHLYSLQILQNNFYTQLGKQQYNATLKMNPSRGLIYDRNGLPLALNKETYAAFVIPKDITNMHKLQQFLSEHYPQAAERLANHKDKNFLYIKRKLSDQELELIKNAQLTDIKILKEPNRFYPINAVGNIIGITDIDNKGQFGIEQLYDQELAGSPTTVCLESEARSGHFYFKKETRQAGSDGTSLTLTIDGDLQFLVAEELRETITEFNGDEGAVLIMDPESGQILAMASYPTFNPNDTKELNLEHTKNRCISDTHEFGSIMKTFVALALLEENLVDPEEIIDCHNTKTTTVGGIKISTWKGHGLLTFSEVIQKSNNIGMVKTALRLGNKLYDHYIKVGFGKKKLNMPNEQTGFVNHPQNWSKLSLASLSFGYEITATLLQLACAFCSISNGGYALAPTLILDQTIPAKEQIYSPQAVEHIQKILEKTVTYGTAHHAQLNGYTVRGKTGSGIMIIDGKYCPSSTVYCFVGDISKGEYKRVIATYIVIHNRRNLYASTVAAPLFEKIANRLLIHDKVI